MRTIVYGIGAIGGTVAAAMVAGGQEVLGIARGRQLDAIRAGGLRLRAPGATVEAALDCVADPSEIEFRPDDAILLTMKTQDTVAALDRLRECGVRDQPIFCLQNGVANERFARRRFPNVHAATVLMPASYLTPGEVCVFAAPLYGIFDIGRYPEGTDDADRTLATAFAASNMRCDLREEVMRSKYGKLILNLGNIVEAALGGGNESREVSDLARAEAREVLSASGIDWDDLTQETDAERTTLMKGAEIEGVERKGGSTTQSLARGAGSIETDYLNGEIVLLGGLAGVATPVNGYLTGLSARLLREGAKPGALTLDDLRRGLRGAGAKGL